jgi:hypothetical protein
MMNKDPHVLQCLRIVQVAAWTVFCLKKVTVFAKIIVFKVPCVKGEVL